MRVSSRFSDSGYPAFVRLGGQGSIKCILLDGQPVRRCITADEELGEVLDHEVSPDGRLVVEGGHLVDRWRRGRVEVVLP